MGWDEMRKSTQKGRSVKPVPWQGAVKREKKNIHMAFGHKDHRPEGKRAGSPREGREEGNLEQNMYTLMPT